MTRHSRNLPSNFDRLDEQIAGTIVDSIIVYPRSHGTLYLPGEYSVNNRPPTHQYRISAAGAEGYEVEPVMLGDRERYRQGYKVWNYRDSVIFATLELEVSEP